MTMNEKRLKLECLKAAAQLPGVQTPFQAMQVARDVYDWLNPPPPPPEPTLIDLLAACFVGRSAP